MVRAVYMLGLAVCLLGFVLWPIIIMSQLSRFWDGLSALHSTNRVKLILLIFSVVALVSSLDPAWYYAYRIMHVSHPGPITFIRIVSDITFRAVAEVGFFLIYMYDIKEPSDSDES